MPSTLTESSYIFTNINTRKLNINGLEESDEDEGEGIMDPRYALKLKICKCLDYLFRILLVSILLSGIIGFFAYIIAKNI